MASLGKVYPDGATIVRQGDEGETMYVIQEGRVEVVVEDEDGEYRMAILGSGDFFGEMAIFERVTRAATVRALGEARILTVDKRTFLRRVQEDPTLAFNILKTLSRRIRSINGELTALRSRYGLEGQAEVRP